LAKQVSDRYGLVYDIVRCIPFGKVTTYGHIAAAIGVRSGARLVGWALNCISGSENADIPAHRVVNRFGALSGRMHFETPYAMRERLESEGVSFNGEYVDLEQCLWIPEPVANNQ